MKTLVELKEAVLADGIVDAAEVAEIKEVIYADGVIDAEEAAFLFEVNDAVSGKENAPEWTELFVEALTDFVLKDEVSPGVVDAEEAAELISKIEGDGVVDATELALLVNIIATAESVEEVLVNFTMTSLKAAILEDGIVDAEEVEMLKKVIYGTGGFAGTGVDRVEADLLFDINDAVSGKENDASWEAFFVEAISAHVLEDEVSPGEIDAEEGDWLIGKIEGDGEYDAVEKALLANIKAKATKIDGKLSFKIEMFVA